MCCIILLAFITLTGCTITIGTGKGDEKTPKVETQQTVNNTSGNSDNISKETDKTTTDKEQDEEVEKDITYKNEDLGFSLTFPADWKGLYEIRQVDGGIKIYYKSKETELDEGYLFAIVDRSKNPVPEDYFDSVGDIRTFKAKGITYIIGGPTDMTYSEDHKDYIVFNLIRLQCPDVIKTLKEL